MKTTPLLLALALAASTTPLMAAEGTPAIPSSSEEWVRYLSDFTRNADMLVDPKKFVAALNQVTDPGFLVTAVNALMDP